MARLHASNRPAHLDGAVLTRGEHSIRITSLPGRHATGVVRRLLPPVMGSMLQFSTTDGAMSDQMHSSGKTRTVRGFYLFLAAAITVTDA